MRPSNQSGLIHESQTASLPVASFQTSQGFHRWSGPETRKMEQTAPRNSGGPAQRVYLTEKTPFCGG